MRSQADRTRRFGAAVAIVLSVAMAASGCASDGADQATEAFGRRFLDPLATADLAYVVENTCHLERRSNDEPWHLETRVQIDASRDQVADVLEAEGVVVVRDDREVFTVQQEPGEPRAGWNGVLEDADTTTSLGLTYNDVEVDEPGGWAEVCALPE